MKINVNSLIKIFMTFEIVLADCIFLGTVLEIKSIPSVIFYGTFIVLLFCIAIFTSKGKIDKYYVFLLVLSIVNVIINALMSPIANISFEYFKKAIMFISSMTFFVLIRDIEFEDVYHKYALGFGLTVAIGFPLAYFVFNNHTMYGRYLTMGFNNPNFTSFWLLHGVLFSVIAFIKTKQKWLKIVLCLVIGSLLYIAILTENRSIWFAISGFIILLVYGFLAKQKLLNNRILTVIVLLPIISVFLYYFLLRTQFFQRTFSFMISEGKALDSRIATWTYALDRFKTNWITGDYSGLSNGTGKSQMHNTHLDVLCSYGIVPFILFTIELRNIVTTVAKDNQTVEQYVAMCAFMSAILYGTFEAALFSGCEGLNYLTGALLILAQNSQQSKISKPINNHQIIQ